MSLGKQEPRKSTSTDPVFLKACELANVPATRRQESKYRNEHGAAFKMKMKAKRKVTEAAS